MKIQLTRGKGFTILVNPKDLLIAAVEIKDIIKEIDSYEREDTSVYPRVILLDKTKHSIGGIGSLSILPEGTMKITTDGDFFESIHNTIIKRAL